MSIIYEALLKVEKKESVNLAVTPVLARRFDQAFPVLRKKDLNSWFLTGAAVCFLLLAGLYLVNIQARQFSGNRAFAFGKKAPYVLQGVIYDQANPIALVNGKQVGLGDRVGNAVVLDISGNHVELLVNEEKIYLPLD